MVLGQNVPSQNVRIPNPNTTVSVEQSHTLLKIIAL